MSTVSSIYSRLEDSKNRLTSHRNIRIILSNMTGLFAVTAVLLGIMVGLCFMLDEAFAAPAFAIAFAFTVAITVVLKVLFPHPEELQMRHAMIVAALAYLAVPAVSTIPFLMIEHMSLLDGFFEAISGWTCTGITMIAYPEHSTRVIQLWRSVIEWIGGLGVILLMTAILIRPGTSTYLMYQSETHRDKIQPSIRSTIKMIWFLYLALTLAGMALLFVVGMPLWDSINHSMVAFGTGGFSIWSDSIAHYHSAAIEMAIIILMVLGALPIVFIFKSIKKPKNIFPPDSEVKAYFFILVTGVLFLALEIYLLNGDIPDSLRISAFHFISALTSTGLQTTDLSGWSHTALLILSIAMVIGGCAGSTSGGLKISRVLVLVNEFELWMKQTLMPRNAIVTLKIGNKRMPEDAIRKELAEATLICFLYLISILISVMILSYVVDPGYDLSMIVLTVSSVQGNAGLQTTIITPDLHWIGKVLFMFDMWIGRLEIIPVTLLIRYMIKGFKI